MRLAAEGHQACSSLGGFGYNAPVELTPFPRPENNRNGPRPVLFFTRIVFGAALFSVAGMVAAPRASEARQRLLAAETGKGRHADSSAYPWYPGSHWKLLTLDV